MLGYQLNKRSLVGAKQYVKKPIPIRAIQITKENFWVASLEGNHQGKCGDYLVEGVNGELYICDKKIFKQTYKESELPRH